MAAEKDVIPKYDLNFDFLKLASLGSRYCSNN